MQSKTINALKWIIGIFEKYKVNYQISGGLAAKLYGSKRDLNDIDIDISESNFATILPEIKPYITFGPAHYKDEKWDLDLITLNYNGQEIDISGIDNLRISNKARVEWISYPDLSNALTLKIEGIDLKVIHPTKLIEYKKELDGDHQIEDIKATEEYVSNMI